MAEVAKKGASHSHSWWWDSHISPKHSRWLKGNLEDMDLKVREMLKLIEQDADSFAKRAEMFYKKRPEIISLLEEFYRGYRAVAERYDRAVGEINNGQTDVADISPLKVKQANEAVSPRKPLRGALRKNLKEINASKQEDREFSTDTEVKSNENPSLKVPPQSPRANKIEALSQSKLQKDLFKAQQQIEVLKQDCARGAEQFSIIEVTMLKLQDIIRITKEENVKLKGESAFYKNKISELEGQIKMPKKENVELIEKGNIDVSAEEEKDKSDLYVQTQQMSSLSESLITQPDTPHKYLTQEPAHEGKMFATLEDKLLHCQLENSNLRMQVMSQSQQLQRANEENENFHQAFLASQVEKNSLAFQYQQYVQLYENSENKLKELQLKLAVMLGGNGQLKGDTEEGRRFISQDDSVYRLARRNSSPSECLSRNSDDLDRRVQMQESSNQIVSLDAILNNYRTLLSQSQEQQKFMSAELYVKNEKLKDVDRRIKILEEEIEHLQKENGNLQEKSSAAVLSVKNLEQEVNRLREENSKLFSEVSFRVDQRDVLQQELYCLKEDRNDLDRRYHVIMKEMQLLGLDVENFSSACSSLQFLRQKLNVLFESTGENSVNINGVLQNVEELMHRNKTLENSISSLISDSKKHAYQLKLLEQVNESFQKEKVELIVEAEKYKDKVRVLEGQLEEFYSASNTVRVENKSLSDELSEAREKVMHLESQAGNWLTEKEAFQDEISRCNMVLSSLENEVESLKAEGRDLKKMLEEETAKVRMSAAEMDNLQREMCEMNKKNQCLSEENVRFLKLCGASKETETELQTSLFNKQREHDILLQQFSFAMQFKKNLEVEIGKLQKFVADREDDVVETNSGSIDGIRLLQTVSQKLTDYQAKLAYQMEEKNMLFDKMSARDAEVEKLKKDVLDLSLERTLAEDALASTLQKLSDLEKELERWQKAATAMEQKVEDGVARERNLSSDLQILQEALTSSESTKSALEEEHAMVLAKYESSKTWLDKRESIVSKIENDHKSLLIESLSDGFLITILGNIIAEKDEEVHWLRDQLALLQRVSEIEKERLEIPAAKLDIQEVESQQFTESIYGSQEDDEPQSDEDGEFSLTSPVNYTEFEIQTGDERVKEIRDYGSRNNIQEKELESHLATGNKEYELMFEDADTERRNSGFMILEFNKDGKALRNGVQSSTKNIEEEGFDNKDSNYLQLDMLKVEENTCETENRTKHVRHLEEQVRELIDTVRDLQQENSSLKGERSTESGDTGSLRMKERQYGKSQTSESLTVEGATNAQQKEVIVHEVNAVTAAEDRVNHEIELLKEQNIKVGTRFDSMTQQMRRMQHTFESLQQQFWRMRQDSNTSPKNANTTWAKNNALAKQFRELQNEVLFWLELNDLLKQEVQYRFVSLNRVNLEIAAIMSQAKSGEASVSCSSELQTKFNDIQEENMKIAEMLQLGADRARALEFQVEEILLKFQGQNQMFIPVQNLKTPNSEKIRVPLRTYIFGKKEQRKKRGTCFCTQQHTHD